MKRYRLLTALFTALLFTEAAASQTISQQPAPPPQICANGQCLATVNTNSSTSTNTSGHVKWNPGQYMASEGTLYGNVTLASFTGEMDDLNGLDNVQGYRLLVSWGALEPTEGNYNFSVLDAILNRLQTQYNKPKRLVISLVPGNFGNCHIGTNDYIPLYIQQNSVYGASPLSGTSGWWGATQNGAVSGACVAAVWRPAVMNRFIALVQALGARYDSNPYFEAIMIQEDSWTISNAIDVTPKDSSYSDAAMVAQLHSLLSATTSAFPHTSVVMQNTWLQQATNTQALEQWMVSNRVAPGSADTVGQSAFTSFDYADPTSQLAWGLQAYMGIQAPGSTWTPVDLRQQTHAFMDVEAPDLAGTYFAFLGAADGFEPMDIIAALNQTYNASHAFWTHFVGNEPIWPGTGTVSAVAPWAEWSNLGPIINSHPLVNTSYPASYP